MLSLKTVTVLSKFITIFIAYTISVVITGAGQAWLAKKMGDDTAQRCGFLSWNPWVYIDPVGLFCFTFFHIGWAVMIPINPSLIREPWRTLKINVVYFARPLLDITLTFIALAVMSFFLGGLLISVPVNAYLASMPPVLSALRSIMMQMIFFGLGFFIFSFSSSLLRLLLPAEWEYTDFVIMMFPIVLILFFQYYVSSLLLMGLFFVEHALTSVSGMA